MDVLDFDNCCYAAAQQFETMYGYKLRLSTDLFVCSYFCHNFWLKDMLFFSKIKAWLRRVDLVQATDAPGAANLLPVRVEQNDDPATVVDVADDGQQPDPSRDGLQCDPVMILGFWLCLFVCVWFWPSPFQVIPWPLDFGSCRFYAICLLRHELLNDCGITGVPRAEFLALPFHDQLPLACLGYIIIFVQSLFLSPHIFPASLDPGHCQATIVPLFVWALGVQERPWLNSCLVYTPKFSNSLF